MNKKKILSVAIALIMCLSVFSVLDFAYATETVETKDGVVTLTVDEEGVKHYTKDLSDEELDEILNAQIQDVIQEEIEALECTGIATYATSKPKPPAKIPSLVLRGGLCIVSGSASSRPKANAGKQSVIKLINNR